MNNKLQNYYDSSKKFEADAVSSVPFDYDMDMISIPKYSVRQKIDTVQLQYILTGKSKEEVDDIMRDMIKQDIIGTYDWVDGYVGKRNMMSPSGFRGWVTVCFHKG